MQYSGAYISSVELGKRPPSPKFRAEADRVMRTGGTLELMWEQLQLNVFVPGFSEFTAREAEASVIRMVEFRLIPGLLQTEEYARAVELGFVRRGRATAAQVSERVKALQARQRCLARTQPPTVHVILDEACLHRCIGGPEVMVRQLTRLEEQAQHPNTIIQIAPFDLGEDQPFMGPLILLTMPNRTQLAYCESAQRGYLEREAEKVASLAADYDLLQVEALPRTASLDLIRDARKNMEHRCTTTN
jgi:hypothetical protein